MCLQQTKALDMRTKYYRLAFLSFINQGRNAVFGEMANTLKAFVTKNTTLALNTLLISNKLPYFRYGCSHHSILQVPLRATIQGQTGLFCKAVKENARRG